MIEALDLKDCRNKENGNRRERLQHLDEGHAESGRTSVRLYRGTPRTHVRYAVLLKIREPENRTPMGMIDLRYNSGWWRGSLAAGAAVEGDSQSY